jgi:mono/diheme cytochrome c family protein
MLRYLAIAGLSLMALPVAAQQPPGDPVAGGSIAQRGCAQCHVTGANASQAAVNGVPTFIGLARDPSIDIARLRGFMQAPHPSMPDLALTRREIDDVTAYILSLRQH